MSYGATALLLHVCEEGHEGYIVGCLEPPQLETFVPNCFVRQLVDLYIVRQTSQPISGSLSNVHVVSRLAVELKVDGEEEHTSSSIFTESFNSQPNSQEATPIWAQGARAGDPL